MQITYSCKGLSDMSIKSWEGKINIIRFLHPFEFSINARGSSFQLILGHYEYGYYVCIPNWKIGCDISTLSDIFWNMENLCAAGLDIVDAITIVDALEVLENYIDL